MQDVNITNFNKITYFTSADLIVLTKVNFSNMNQMMNFGYVQKKIQNTPEKIS